MEENDRSQTDDNPEEETPTSEAPETDPDDDAADGTKEAAEGDEVEATPVPTPVEVDDNGNEGTAGDDAGMEEEATGVGPDAPADSAGGGEQEEQDEAVETAGAARSSRDSLVAELREQEEPLSLLYEQLMSTMQGSTERRITESLRHYQRYQLECLRLLDGQVPDKFQAFGLVTHKDVNVRQNTSGKSALIDEVDRGTRVVIQEKSGFWYRVQLSDGREGYIFQDYVREDEL